MTKASWWGFDQSLDIADEIEGLQLSQVEPVSGRLDLGDWHEHHCKAAWLSLATDGRHPDPTVPC